MIFFTFAGRNAVLLGAGAGGRARRRRARHSALSARISSCRPSSSSPSCSARVLESIVTVIILGPLLLPVALQLGVDPLQFGIVLIEAFGIGSIIPPVGLGPLHRLRDLPHGDASDVPAGPGLSRRALPGASGRGRCSLDHRSCCRMHSGSAADQTIKGGNNEHYLQLGEPCSHREPRLLAGDPIPPRAREASPRSASPIARRSRTAGISVPSSSRPPWKNAATARSRSRSIPTRRWATSSDIAQAVRLGSHGDGRGWRRTDELGAGNVDHRRAVPVPQPPAGLCGAGRRARRRAEAPRRGKGFRIVGWTDLGMRCMTNSKHPIHQASDMHDLKMRVPDSKSYIAMMQAMGSDNRHGGSERTLSRAQPARRRWPGHAALRRQVKQILRGAEIRLQDRPHPDQRLRHHQPGLLQQAAARIEQAAVLAAGHDATMWLRDYTQKDEANAYDFLQSKGMMVDLTPDIASFQAATAGVITKFPDLFQPRSRQAGALCPAEA